MYLIFLCLKHQTNIIRDVENSMEIKQKIWEAISNISLVNTANNLNTILAHERLDYNANKKKVLALYESIANFKQ